MNKVIVRIVGGIGNQLFCYAAARRLAIVNNAELIIDNVSGFTHDYKYRRTYQLDHFNITARKSSSWERLEPFERYRRWVMRKVSSFKPFEMRAFIKEERMDFDPRFLDIRVSGKIYLEGYWQSENYFKDVEGLIRDDLRILTPVDLQNRKMASVINCCNSVALHVRWFHDPNSSGGVNNLVDGYYKRAIKLIKKRVPNAHFFIFSDDPIAAQQRIGLPDNQVTPVFHNQGDEHAYADMWLMSQCQHFIIANSSFSWWGAWLSKSMNKTVIAPALELREGESSWGFDGLIPDEWIKL